MKKNKPTNKEKFIYLYGKHPVFAALSVKKRSIKQILITKNSQAEFEQFIRTKKINIGKNLIRLIDNKTMRTKLGENAVHQGFALLTDPHPTISYQKFLENLKDEKILQEKILILDNLTDPQNIGAIIRSAAAFNFNKILILEKTFPFNSPALAKAAAGNLENIDLIAVNNLAAAMNDLKKADYWLFGLAGEAKKDICALKQEKSEKTTHKITNKVALIIGAEGPGIRPLIKKSCDLLIKIKTNSKVESLNAANAATIAMYEFNND